MLSRSIAFVAVVATLTGVVARIEVAPTEVTLLSARYVRSIDTAELGIPSPRGIALQPDGSLLVQGEGTAARITTGGDLVEVADGSGHSGPGLTTRHPVTGMQYELSPDDDLLEERDAHGTPHATYRLAELDLIDPRGITFAPSADSTDDPDQQHLFIADAGDDGTVGGIMEVSLEPGLRLAATPEVVVPQVVQVIETSQFTPGSPDPAGIVHLPGTDRMYVVDSEVDETTGAGYHGVNLWQVTRTGTVTDTGTTYTPGPNFSKEPTGLGYIPATNTLLVSDDSNDRVWLVRPGSDGRHGTADDVISSINAASYGSGDTEDPEYDAATGHIFFIDGTNREVYRVDPVNGVFGDGNDIMTQFDVAKDGMLDVEGLSSDPTRGTLLVGDRRLQQIFEYTKTGELLRIIDSSDIPGMRFVSGVGFGPASSGPGNSYWTVDRAIDNGADSNENDGRIFELRIEGPTGSPPVPVADTASTAEDTAVTVNVAANDSDVDGNLDPTSVSVTAQPANGTATPNGTGRVTYTPDTNFNGTNTLTYQICDTTNLCATTTATITVTPVADPPAAIADSAATVTNTPVTVDVAGNDSDPDGNLDPTSVSVTAQPANGTATPNGTGRVTYTPDTNFNGTNTLTYQICDTTNLCATTTATITVTPVADPPLAVADSATTGTGTPSVINVAGNDSDPDGNLDPTTVTVTVPPANGTATPNGNGTVTYTPSGDYQGPDGFTYRICDTTTPTPLCATATASITVAAGINHYYVSLSTSATIQGISVSDEDIIAYDRATGAWAMYFDASDVGLTASDLQDFHIRADGSVLMSFSSAIDVPGLTGGPDGTLVDGSDIFLFTPTFTGADTAGTFSFYFDGSDVGLDGEVLDGIHELADGTLMLSTTGSASVAGLSVADEDAFLFTPSALGATTTGAFDAHFDGSDVGLTASNDDLDGIGVDTNGDLLYSTSGDNTVPGTLDEDINRFTGTYGPTTSGTAVLQLALAPLGIPAGNDVDGLHTRADGDTSGSGPVALDDEASTAEDTAVTIDVAANDTDPDDNLAPGSVTVTVAPANGTATANGNGTVTYTPNADFNGTNTLTYRICDTTSLCATATVTVTVTASADPPVAVDDRASTPDDTAVTIDVAANDSDPDDDLAPASVNITAPPANGTATPNGDGTVTYTPTTSFNGSTTFTYEVCDTTGLCATATVTVTVGGVDRYYVSLDSNATIAGAGSVRDEDIIVYDPASSSWAMFFDASDVGITTSDLEDLHVRANGSILMSFSSSFNVPNLTGGPDGTLVDDSDIVLFTPTSTGADTAGTFSFYFDGSDVGLETNNERLDSFHELADGTLVLSTTGAANVPGLSGADEDLLWYSPGETGATTTGTWIGLYFDGSDVGLTSGNDDIDAIAFDANGDLLYSTSGDNTVPGTLDEDINRFTGTYGPTTTGTATLELALAPLGIATTNDIDGLHTAR